MSASELSFLAKLEDIVRDRIANPTDNSYTATLAAAGSKRIAQKIGEEGVELALASVDGARDEILDEAADLVYHLVVLLADQDLALADVAGRLEARHAESEK